jgi:hypothetical protein
MIARGQVISVDPFYAGRRPEVEELLDRVAPGEWRFEPEVPLDYFDLDSSLDVRVRAEDPRLRPQDVIDQYAAEMRRGALFPPIVVAGDIRPRGLFIIDGIMIYQAAVNANHTHHPAYLVTTGLHAIAAHFLFNTHPFPIRPRYPLEQHLRQTGEE